MLVLFDRIGEWTKLKHDIVQYYAETYSNIMTRGSARLTHCYIDAYASAGISIERATKKLVLGSALRTLAVRPPFAEYFFVEQDEKRFSFLKTICNEQSNVKVYHGDANEILPREIFPNVRYNKRERAFCLLDPYNETHLRWHTVVAAASTQAIDLLIHFPMYSLNINVLRKRGPENDQRLDDFWGDHSWVEVAYEAEQQTNLLGEDWITKLGNEDIVNAYRDRLIKVAKFEAASRAIPMRNKRGNIVYYLIFATCNKPTGARAINQVANFFIKRIAEG